MISRRHKWLIVLLITLVFTGNIIRYSHRSPKRHYGDFRVYYSTGERFLKKENIYSRPDESITPFKYSPFFACLFSPLTRLSQYNASLVFFTINFLLVIAIMVLIKRLIASEGLTVRQYWLLYFLSILFTSRFILLVWDSGQVTLLIFFLVTGGMQLIKKDKHVFGSACIGAAVLIKYLPAIMVPYYIFRKKYKAAALIVLFVFIFSMLPAFYAGLHKEITYLKDWMPFITQTSLDKSSWFDYKNQSLYSMILRYTTTGYEYSFNIFKFTFYQGVAVSVLMGTVIYLSILVKGKNDRDSLACDYGMLFICMALFNPNAWMTNFIYLLFGYMYVLYYLIKNGWKDKAVFSLVIISFILCSWASQSVVGNSLENAFERASSITIGALFLMFALFKLKYGRSLKKEQDV